MKFKNFILAAFLVFSILVAVSFASASDLVLTNSSSLSLSIAHGSSAAISFILSNTNTTGENYTVSWSVTPDSPLTKSSTSGYQTLMLNGTSTSTLTNTISVPFYTSAGNYNARVKAVNGTTESNELTYTITVPSSNALSITNTQSITRSQNGTIRINNTGNTQLSNIALAFSGNFNVSFSTSTISSLAPGTSSSVNVNLLTDWDDIELGAHSITINATASDGTSNTLSYSVSGDFCEYGNINASEVEIKSINAEASSSSDDWKWKPHDNITIEVEVKNNLDDEEEFTVEIALYDTTEDEFVELDGEDTLEETISIDEDSSEDVEFSFTLPSDLEESTGRYVLYVKAYVDGEEENYCNSGDADSLDSGAESIEIEKDNHEIILDNIESPEIATAGETITISATAFNIGSADEDRVKVSIENSKLGIKQESSSFDLDSGDLDEVDFTFTIPSTAEDGYYTFALYTYYNYKSSSGSYSDTSDAFDIVIKIVGGIKPSANKTIAGISASLTSDAVAGQNLTVNAIITNLNSNRTTFAIDARGYESWAKLNSLSDSSITLNAGESKTISIVLDVNKDVSGQKSFFLDVSSGSKTESKELAVTIGASSLLARLKNSLTSNYILWIIGAVNLILIILIVVVVARIATRR